MDEIESVLSFWFHPENAKNWFSKNSDFDRDVRARFEPILKAIMADQHEDWLETPRGRLAYVIVLDQLSRNMYRGTPEMFAQDDRALEAATGGIDRGHDKKLPPDQRLFLYMPLMHSEDRDVQDRSVYLFKQMRDEAPPDQRQKLGENVRYAEMHRDIIKRFGRFPHRNSLLDRTSTAEEVEFLTEPNSAF